MQGEGSESPAGGAGAPGIATVIDVIRSEHRSLGRVIHALQKIAMELRAGLRDPDFALLCAMLYYIDIFPDRVHHPKEEIYLFKALRLRITAANELLDKLQEEHIRGAHLLHQVDQMLVRYQGGAPDGAEIFASAVETYADLHWNHVRREEQEVLPLAARHLAESDCWIMAKAFLANEDPLFGARPLREFDRLLAHIFAVQGSDTD